MLFFLFILFFSFAILVKSYYFLGGPLRRIGKFAGRVMTLDGYR